MTDNAQNINDSKGRHSPVTTATPLMNHGVSQSSVAASNQNINRTAHLDLIALAAGPMLTPEQRRKLVPPCGTGPRGHVAPPGTGPEGETCGSCVHLYRNVMAKTYLKCGLNRGKWTGGGKTDVRARDHACRQWAASKG